MQTILKEGKATQITRQINPSVANPGNKKKGAVKYTKLGAGYNGIYAVINMQEDEDAAVRADVWN
jgi:hypothetical protein